MAFFDSDFAARRVVVFAAPNGARRSRSEHPAVPETATELAECAISLRDVGVSVLHLHVRDADGRHTLSVARYTEAIAAIRDAVGDQLVIQVTTEAVGRYSAAEQMAMVRSLRPEAVSLALRELLPTPKDEAAAAEFFGWLVRHGIWPQYIVYTVDELKRFDALRRRGVFSDDRPFCMLVLGRYAAEQRGSLEELDAFLRRLPEDAFPWAVCCFGPAEHAVMCAATERLGHVRLGFENNIMLADGRVARDNAELVAEYLHATRASDRRAATADEVRSEWRQG